jgi:hypothetical protein
MVSLQSDSLLLKDAKIEYDSEKVLSKVSLEKLLEYSYLNLKPYDFLDINNELLDRDPSKKYENPIFELMDFMREPENFAFTCKWLFDIHLMPFQIAILKELWRRKFPMFIGSRGCGKSYLLSLYSVLRILFCPGSKVIFVGAGFRQSKILFEYVEAFFRASPIFRNIIGTNRTQGPKHDTDRHSFYAGDSVIHALPIGDGQKIRGMRATNIVSDEFSSLQQEIFEVVIRGFGAVNVNPVERVRKISGRKVLKQLGIDNDKFIDEEDLGNQTIISGTAFYSWNHFYNYWTRYRSIIRSRGDKDKLEEIFQGEIPDNFDWTDYSVIRLPYESIPEGVMDEKSIAQAQALMHAGLHKMEYSACVLPDTNIILDTGCKKIIDVEVGDKVLTHTGQFKKVIKRTFRKYTGDIVRLRCYGYNQDICITPEHKVFYNNTWKAIGDINDKVQLSTSECIIDYKIASKIYEPYDGFVYNLEVEDDNSYSLPCMTVHNCFQTDSNGFFKRSLIESCVTTKPIDLPSGSVQFRANINGNNKHKFVYGIDPASEDDNFTIIILEIHEDHRRIVYGWSATKQKLRERLKKVGKDSSGTSYYSYCARKVRELMKIFPTEHIVIDKQGGGIPLIEAFHHTPDLEIGEYPLWPYLVRGKDDPFWWEKEEKPTDNESGLHIIHEYQFADSKLVEESNHSLRKDLETKTLLFPMFDSIEIGLSTEQDLTEGREYDTLEDCVLEIEELKNELSTITHSRTPSGKDKWSTPEIKEPGGRIGRLRKDRYSALVMANQVARTIGNTIGKIPYKTSGSYVSQHHKKDEKSGPSYYGASHVVDQLSKYSGCSVRKD